MAQQRLRPWHRTNRSGLAGWPVENSPWAYSDRGVLRSRHSHNAWLSPAIGSEQGWAGAHRAADKRTAAGAGYRGWASEPRLPGVGR